MIKLKPFIILLFCGFLLTNLTLQAQNVTEKSRTSLNFDQDWRFLKADANGAEVPAFDDSKWRKLDVPHDWSIEGHYDKENLTSRGGGYLPSGIGWYRKSFTVSESDAKQKILIEFDGVMANSDVWINGFHLGKRPYGYISFSYDLTGHINFGKGKTNILAVRADNSVQPASRYYSGAGIYRHVRLVVTNPVHLDQWGVYISTSQVSGKKATVNFQTKVLNESSISSSIVLETKVFDPSGKMIQSTESRQSIATGQAATINQSMELVNPELWDIGKPNLYRAVTKIKSGKNTIDEQINNFGIRDSRFEAATGYWLNGKNIKIKGVCLHHDGGALGAAVPLGVWERRLKLMKETGANAIRTAHNPVAPEFLDLCDRMGFLVMDETFDTWTAAKPNGEKGYNLYFNDWWEKDTRDMVLRDRNHPSIIIYSVGNEIRDNLNDSTGFKKYKDQQDLIHELDPGCPVTMALFRPGSSKVYTNGFVEKMDVVGQNYREKELVDVHLAKPNLIVLGTENGDGLSEWLILRDNPFMSGQFLWTGVDYLGEALWPAVSSRSGLFDRTGAWKPIGYQRQSWWAEKPVVHLVRKEFNAGGGNWVANWTPSDPGTYDDAQVQVYSNCDEVELFINGTSLGAKLKPEDDSPRSWDVTFEKGSLKAVARNNGKEVATDELKTAGAPATIILTSDKSKIAKSWDYLCYVTAKVVDANGIVCPNADHIISFQVSETGTIAAVDNGDVSSHEAYQASERHVYNGQCVAIVKAKSVSGQITVTANSPELISGTVMIEIK
ncbi:MAG TPA: glycoside hydrolase family 2 TIM barrel-domain containing protein [Prolixibacteraceae bacterium]|nr:glycoside hydrolase family 2 TIM barrel-domain containing protein [Prolixibacteraceae bacterium]